MVTATLIQYFTGALAEQFFTYLIFATPFFLVFWVVWKKRAKSIRIQPVQKAGKRHFLHDIAFSMSSVVIFAALDAILLYLQKKGFTLLYFDMGKYGWAWAVLSACILLFLNDTFFYWSHRAMHHPKLYPIFHKVHHQSTDPSPFTAFAFHPLEALVENMALFIIPFVIPLHFGVLLAVQVFDMLNNVSGHLGYELCPKFWTKTPFLKYKTTSTHHNMHHQQFDGNYALYFTWWDKWMGTEFTDYAQRQQAIFERGKAPVLSLPEPAGSIPAPTLVTVQLNGKTYQFYCDAAATVLESAIAQQVPIPYACKRGRCGTCKMRCTAGKVSMKEYPIFSATEVAEGYILCCQATPTTDHLHLEK
jgi:ring-1,2-phenylacetyl-CoA epoxidase subunit PaaE